MFLKNYIFHSSERPFSGLSERDIYAISISTDTLITIAISVFFVYGSYYRRTVFMNENNYQFLVIELSDISVMKTMFDNVRRVTLFHTDTVIRLNNIIKNHAHISYYTTKITLCEEQNKSKEVIG